MKQKLSIYDIEPGDCLLYRPSSFFGWLIAIKTWNAISHVEIYAGDKHSYASRDGRGVNYYRFRRRGLKYVLRADNTLLNMEAMKIEFLKHKGESYDWLNILFFGTIGCIIGRANRKICSTLATILYRAAGLQIFGTYTAEGISPAQFLMTEDLSQFWPSKS